MSAVMNIIKKKSYHVYLATDNSIDHMVQSNYSHIVPALSAHYIIGQRFPLQIPVQCTQIQMPGYSLSQLDDQIKSLVVKV